MRAGLGSISAALAVVALAAISLAPTAAAEPNPTLPGCQTAQGGEFTGTGETECQTPGNVQIDATAPDAPAYPYPWDDEFYGPALIIAPGAPGAHR